MNEITYEEKMEFLDDLLMRGKLLHETCEGCFPQRHIEIVECLIEDVNQLHELYKKDNVQKKHDPYEELFLK